MWLQKEIKLPAKNRGFHLITDEVLKHLPEITEITLGVIHIFIKHTSASLTINENADPTVRQDFESYFNHSVAEDEPYYRHTYEGSDDMPAHLKASLLGANITMPIKDGRLNIGIWQGIYLGEHRDYGGSRTLVVTINGENR